MIKKVYIIAEVGSVHDGSLGNALKLVSLAKKLGANAVKFQTHISEYETLFNAPNPNHFKDESRYKYFKRTAFSFKQYKKIVSAAKKNNIDLISSPFSIEAVEFLEKLKFSKYKVASGEVTNIPLLEKLKKTNKKIFLSTGMSNIKEINEAVKVLNKSKLTIMQCTSLYPCDLSRVGINNISIFKKKFKCEVGFSDHTATNEASIIAVHEGATVIEKHLTFSKEMYGSDAKFAMEPDNFKNFCESIRNAEKLVNYPTNKNNLSKDILKIKKIYQKSIVLNKNLKKNKIIKFEDLSFKKPQKGLDPKFYKKLIGKKIKRNMNKDSYIKFKDIK